MMKSFISILPIVGAAVAIQPPQCSSQAIVTKTETNTHYVTVTAEKAKPTIVAVESSQSTRTTTIWHTLYVTKQPSPSAPAPSVPSAPAPHYPYPNGTWNDTRPYPTASTSVVYELPSSVEEVVTPLPSTYEAAPVPTAEAPSNEAPSKAPAAPEPVESPVGNAPVEGTTPEVSKQATSGKATFYGGNLSGGMCSFTGYTLPAGLYGTAFSGAAWNSGANCGRCVNVKGPNGSTIKAMIVDQCPECEASHLDLFQNAFEKIGSISAGIIPISYDFVDCGITSPIVLKNKEGTSPYWFSMQVMNSNVPVSKLEVSTDGGNSWKSTSRKEYNYFENPSGFGTNSVDVKVTSTSGKSIVVKGVSIAASSTKTASSNF